MVLPTKYEYCKTVDFITSLGTFKNSVLRFLKRIKEFSQPFPEDIYQRVCGTIADIDIAKQEASAHLEEILSPIEQMLNLYRPDYLLKLPEGLIKDNDQFYKRGEIGFGLVIRFGLASDISRLNVSCSISWDWDEPSNITCCYENQSEDIKIRLEDPNGPDLVRSYWLTNFIIFLESLKMFNIFKIPI